MRGFRERGNSNTLSDCCIMVVQLFVNSVSQLLQVLLQIEFTIQNTLNLRQISEDCKVALILAAALQLSGNLFVVRPEIFSGELQFCRNPVHYISVKTVDDFSSSNFLFKFIVKFIICNNENNMIFLIHFSHISPLSIILHV